MTEIAENLRDVRERIARAATAAGRSPDEVQLVAVSKTFPVASISEAISAGQTCFGENRVQEAEPKIRHFHGEHRVEWHLVGHLQSNKARKACELFDVIHSLDSIRLAQRISQACLELNKNISLLLQVDLGREETKSGADPEQVRGIIEAVSTLNGIRLDGLMTLPPLFDDPERTRPYFSQLRELLHTLEAERPGCLGRRHLSMGMSHDFETAIQEGATMVRIGTSIFGARTYGHT
jgi:pyridoxal phosphate enzyme (YggS family)